MSKITKSFGICVKQCGIQNRNTNDWTQLFQGDLIRILHVDGNKSDKIVVKLYNSEENCFKSDLFECVVTDVDHVVEELWLYLISTQENHIRMRIYNERNLVLQLKCGSEITIKSYENDSNANITGVVELIDNVQEVGVGYFIGLKLKDIPKNRVTLVSLYKKHFNNAKSMLLFRIDQLLDPLIDSSNEVNVVESDIRINKLNVNAPSFHVGDRACEVPKSTGSPISSLIKSPSEINSNLCLDPLASGQDTVNSCISPQTSSDYICDLKSNLPVNTEKLEHLELNSSLSKSEIICANTDENKRHANDMPAGVQLTKVPINEKDLIFKNEPVVIRKKNGRYNESKTKKNLPKTLYTSCISSEQVRRNKSCCICNSPFSDNMLILKCKHNICGECFGIKASSLTRNSRVQCPFNPCNYQLRYFEFIQLRKILEILETNDNRLCTTKRNDFDNEELLVKSSNKKCEDELYISKLDTNNLFRCPLCKINNGDHCKAIHEDIICMVEKLRNLIESFIPTVSKQSGLQKIVGGTNVPDTIESLMKCININCVGHWFIQQNDKSQLYKCPICNLFNCIKCNAIHENQTCDEYKAVGQPKSSPNSKTKSTYKNSSIRPNSNFNRNCTYGKTGVKSAGNAKIIWSCAHCTFENFNVGRYCNICHKPNKKSIN